MNDQVKICPLTASLRISPMKAKGSIYCTRNECAWWVNGKYDHETGCSLAVLARALTVINRTGLTVARG